MQRIRLSRLLPHLLAAVFGVWFMLIVVGAESPNAIRPMAALAAGGTSTPTFVPTGAAGPVGPASPTFAATYMPGPTKTASPTFIPTATGTATATATATATFTATPTPTDIPFSASLAQVGPNLSQESFPGFTNDGLSGSVVCTDAHACISQSYTDGTAWEIASNASAASFEGYPGAWTRSTAATTAKGEPGIGFFGLDYNPSNHHLYYGGAGLDTESSHGYDVDCDLSTPTRFTDATACTAFDPSAAFPTSYAVTSYPVVHQSTGEVYFAPAGQYVTGPPHIASGALVAWNGTGGTFNNQSVAGHWYEQDISLLSTCSGCKGFQFGLDNNNILVLVPYAGSKFATYDETKGAAGISTAANFASVNIGSAAIFNDSTVSAGWTGETAFGQYDFFSQFDDKTTAGTDGHWIARWDTSGGVAGIATASYWSRVDLRQAPGYPSTYLTTGDINTQALAHDSRYIYAGGNTGTIWCRYDTRLAFVASSWQCFQTTSIPSMPPQGGYVGGLGVLDGWVYGSGYGSATSSGGDVWLRFPSPG